MGSETKFNSRSTTSTEITDFNEMESETKIHSPSFRSISFEELEEENLSMTQEPNIKDHTKHCVSAASSIPDFLVRPDEHKHPEPEPRVAFRTASEILENLNIDPWTQGDSTTSTESSDQLLKYEKTLAIIKPDGVKFQDAIEKRIKSEGFEIITKRKIHLTPEQASEFYNSLYGSIRFPALVVFMSSAPILVYCLSRVQAIKHWQHVIGPSCVTKARLYWPSSLRAKYGRFYSIENAVHGSSDSVSADREIRFFFPNSIVEPLATEDQAVEYLNNTVNPTVATGLAELLKIRPVEPIIWLADWLLVNNPHRPKFPFAIAKTNT